MFIQSQFENYSYMLSANWDFNLRRKIRNEVYLLLTWEEPTPSGIFNRWGMSDIPDLDKYDEQYPLVVTFEPWSPSAPPKAGKP